MDFGGTAEAGKIFLLRAPVSRQVKLTPREEAVLAAIAAGLAGAEIAARLAIAPATVRRYRELVRDKLGLRKAAEMAAWHARHRPATDPQSPKPVGPLSQPRCLPRRESARC